MRNGKENRWSDMKTEHYTGVQVFLYKGSCKRERLVVWMANVIALLRQAKRYTIESLQHRAFFAFRYSLVQLEALCRTIQVVEKERTVKSVAREGGRRNRIRLSKAGKKVPQDDYLWFN